MDRPEITISLSWAGHWPGYCFVFSKCTDEYILEGDHEVDFERPYSGDGMC